MAKTRFAFVSLVTVAGLALASCTSESGDAAGNGGTETAAESPAAENTVTVEDNHGEQTVAQPVENVAATDNRAFELLAQWEIPLVAAPVDLIPESVSAYHDNEDIANMGTHRETDLEALVAAEPDVIVNGQRFTSQYEDIAELNPEATMIELEPREGEPLDQELIRHATTLGEVFGKQEEAEQVVADFEEARDRAAAAVPEDATVESVLVSGGEISHSAPGDGRFWGPLYDMIGLTPAIQSEGDSNNHGDDISVEAIAEANPDWLFVLDRDAGTNSGQEEGYTPAQDLIEGNPALSNVTAVQEGNTVYAPEDAYTNESIITYTEVLNDIADGFESAAQ